ncbi:hypothetical protein RB195_001218 [Necator americanus]|uniref:Uncharacterized protein n=1 Tax=Necator americanus TaxID=51031 RepID=A0ABR1DDF7_NECAM
MHWHYLQSYFFPISAERHLPILKGSSWWRNLVMDDDKTRAPKAPPTAPEIIIGDNQALNGSLEERHRNISTISMGDINTTTIVDY